MSFKTIERREEDGAVILIDQRRLPTEETYLTCESWSEVADAIRDMVVRGAPAIGVTAAYGVALGARQLARNGSSADADGFRQELETVCEEMSQTRPTAVNLFWAIDRMRRLISRLDEADPLDVARRLDAEAATIEAEDVKTCDRMGQFGADLVPDGARILTHCNTGALATAGIGTALGVVRAAHEAGKKVHVWADETRPWLQGARLTTWECQKNGIPVSLISDSVAASLMAAQRVDMIVVGADRIAANGDTANKIGTYSVAVAAHHHGVPFYVVAPTTTVDLSLPDGSHIPIEQRDPSEVTSFGERTVAPEGIDVFNPAFDVTPARLIAGIVTEGGVARPPYEASLADLCKR